MQVAVNNRGKLVFSIQSKAVDAEDFRDFLIGIRNEYDKERKIIVVCDNASIHKAKVVKDWIEEDGNFELAFCFKLPKWNGFSLKSERRLLAPPSGFIPRKVLASKLGGGLNQRSP